MKKSNNKSPNQSQFAHVASVSIARSSFDRSHSLKTTLDAGYLTPFFIDEVLPGDTKTLSAQIFARLATPIHPFMDNVYLDTHFFFVPNRLIWDNWQKFMGEQDNPGDSTTFLIPEITTPAGGFTEYSLADYFGLPTKEDISDVSCMWHRAYNLIFNTWYRDENLQDSLVVNKDNGPDSEDDYEVVRRGKRHDYFTSCLPWPQKGDAVTLPIGGTAPVTGIANQRPEFIVDGTGSNYLKTGNSTGEILLGVDELTDKTVYWDNPALVADLSSATAQTINQIRQAFQIQKLLERDARGGTRYTEILRSHFGVTSPDQRLQRPEYLGGGSTMLNVNPVAQTFNEGSNSQRVGDLGGVGTIISTGGHSFSKSFTEHGVVIGLVSIRADMNYQQGVPRMFSRTTKQDFFWPSFSHLGEQAVLSKEIFADGSAGDEDVFGYQERYAEYRYRPSLVTALMRSNATQSTDAWHIAYDFSTRPVLGATFIEENPPLNRVLGVPFEAQFVLDTYFTYRDVRPIPVNGTPGNMDRL